jgi:hypothetical protein
MFDAHPLGVSLGVKLEAMNFLNINGYLRWKLGGNDN